MYLYIHMYVYVYVCTCMCEHTYIYIYVYIYVFIYSDISTHVHVHAYVYTYMYMYICIRICVCRANTSTHAAHVAQSVVCYKLPPLERHCRRQTPYRSLTTFGGPLRRGGSTFQTSIMVLRGSVTKPVIAYWADKWTDAELKFLQVERGHKQDWRHTPCSSGFRRGGHCWLMPKGHCRSSVMRWAFYTMARR